MATQKCPKCGSKNIRHGYRTTHILFKIAFRYNLLCNDCNLEFRGFAIPGTVSKKGKRKKKGVESSQTKPAYEGYRPNLQRAAESDTPVAAQIVSEMAGTTPAVSRNLVKKRVKVKLNRA